MYLCLPFVGYVSWLLGFTWVILLHTPRVTIVTFFWYIMYFCALCCLLERTQSHFFLMSKHILPSYKPKPSTDFACRIPLLKTYPKLHLKNPTDWIFHKQPQHHRRLLKAARLTCNTDTAHDCLWRPYYVGCHSYIIYPKFFSIGESSSHDLRKSHFLSGDVMTGSNHDSYAP